MKHLEDAIVTSNREIRPDIWSMWLRSPMICRDSRPGNFVHVRVTDEFQPLLRRPLSIGRVHDDQLELVWRVIGRGTELLTEFKKGDSLSVFGPLGKSFTIDPSSTDRILIGGGLGLPPLVYLYEELNKNKLNANLLLGVRGQQDIPLADDDRLLEQITIISEIGGGYRQGLVTEPALELLENLRRNKKLESTAVYSCGPWGLVGALQRVLPLEDLQLSEVSLEQQMGCAAGICQGCAVVVNGGDTPYQLVCTDGPVFPLNSVQVPG